MKALPVAGRFSGAPVDHQIVGALGHVGVEVIHQHAQGGFLVPAPATQGGAPGGAKNGRGTHDGCYTFYRF